MHVCVYVSACACVWGFLRALCVSSSSSSAYACVCREGWEADRLKIV